MLWRKSFWVFSVAMAVLPLPEALAARVALVIGNAAYVDSPLRNPVNDARAMAAKLKGLSFEVIARENLKVKDIGKTLQAFQSRIKPGDEALFFYAGHGLQVKGTNYLPAVDAEIGSEQDVPLQSINVTTILDLLEESKAGVKLVFLDACRNNPYSRSFRSSATGLSKVGNAPSGTLISFATRPGSVAADGTGQNGLYTEVLLRYIATPNQPIEQMLKKVASGVEQTSQGKQEPWIEGSIKGDFFFITGPVTIVQQNTTPASLDPETEAWTAARESNSPSIVELYLREYPTGRYASPAKILLAKLKEQNRTNTGTSTSSTNDNKPVVVSTNSSSTGSEDANMTTNQMVNRGYNYANGINGSPKDDVEAVRWYQKAADLNNHYGMRNLGWMYAVGRGVPRNESEAVRWYQKAADAGNTAAMVNLGEMYRDGRGITQSDREAARWYQKAAELGNGIGMDNFGVMLRDGRGVGQDDREAVRWFQKAAAAGEPYSMNNLAWMYEQGRGIEQSNQLALMWYDKAIAAGHPSAKKYADRLREQNKSGY